MISRDPMIARMYLVHVAIRICNAMHINWGFKCFSLCEFYIMFGNSQFTYFIK